MDFQSYKEKLIKVKEQIQSGELDEIPLEVRPPVPDFDPFSETFVMVSYSRKDFEEVYLLLAHLNEKGYRFWYDDGMTGEDKWIEEYKKHYENAHCIGTLLFFSSNYISTATKQELEIIYSSDGYAKQNLTVSLIPLQDIDPEKLLKEAIASGRIDITGASSVLPILSDLIREEKDKTIHRYASEADIEGLVNKIGKVFDTDDKEDTELLCDDPAYLISGRTLKKYAGSDSDPHVPDGVKIIGKDAFLGAGIKSVWLPDSVVSIESCAFRGCAELTTVCLSKKIKIIEKGAFEDCTALESITLPVGLAEIGESAFRCCQKLQSIEIPGTVEQIGAGAFDRCNALKTLKLAEGIKVLGEEAFFSCSSLEHVILPDSIEKIGPGAFAWCKALENVILPKRITAIPRDAFSHTKINRIIIPKGVITIEGGAFQNCPFKSIELPEGLLSIKDQAFRRCHNLESIVIPKNVASIGNFAFSQCRALRSIDLPDGIHQIGMAAFQGCSYLKSVTLPKGMIILEDATFAECSSLREIVLPQGIVSIGEAAFTGCEALSDMILPRGVKILEAHAFSKCKRLEMIIYKGSKRNWSQIKKGSFWRGKVKYVKCSDGVKRVFL